MNLENNVDYDKSKFNVVAVWPGTLLEVPGQVEEFEKFFKTEFGVEVKFLEAIFTKPDVGDPTTGGRSDLFFAIDSSSESFGSFCVRRLSLGIRWLEDAVSELNRYSQNPIYPDRVLNYL
jgi:hypothetical protein